MKRIVDYLYSKKYTGPIIVLVIMSYMIVGYNLLVHPEKTDLFIIRIFGISVILTGIWGILRYIELILQKWDNERDIIE